MTRQSRAVGSLIATILTCRFAGSASCSGSRARASIDRRHPPPTTTTIWR